MTYVYRNDFRVHRYLIDQNSGFFFHQSLHHALLNCASIKQLWTWFELFCRVRLYVIQPYSKPEDMFLR